MDLPSIHDHTLLSYRVSLNAGEIALCTTPDSPSCLEPVGFREVIFEGCEAHYFQYAITGTILGWLIEIPLDRFINEHGAQFDDGFRQGAWPSWWRGSAIQALSYLSKRDQHVFEISSSYGFDGWVIARSVRATEWNFQPSV